MPLHCSSVEVAEIAALRFRVSPLKTDIKYENSLYIHVFLIFFMRA